ncbi:chorismate mutase [Phaeobacter sp. 11ANDIMAR09]|uniref:chorismate mutase n=1 Tax=Phaeobacter sp. 11ANDIMAR09 TaxID=1225647 RepID=UPI0006C88D29|nr:chorismate mutase [Phaeobacter sp. 11ANDIMAR09]KPD13072.1 chorismate mutase [Phaeobacter sp. 11ANDIMAR09]OIQ32197.1 MAG: chorismate mutase [Roseobacter sp. MedPE-SWchi]
MTHLIPPPHCGDMAELRGQIDDLDEMLVELLATRAGYIDRAIELKRLNGWPARIPTRVDEVIENARAKAGEAGLDPDLIETLWRQLVEWSIAREARVIHET